MANSVEAFNEHKEEIRAQLELAIRAYQRLAVLDLAEVTRENASELYQEFAAVEAVFEGVGGVLDRVRHAIQKAGECFTDQLELVGFDGERSPLVTEVVEGEE